MTSVREPRAGGVGFESADQVGCMAAVALECMLYGGLVGMDMPSAPMAPRARCFEATSVFHPPWMALYPAAE